MFDLNELLTWENQPLLISLERTTTFKEYLSKVNQVSAILTSLGVKRSARVALLGNNSEQYLITLLAIIRIGAVACPLSPRLPELGLRQCLTQSACDYLIPLGGTKIDETPDSITIVEEHELTNQISNVPMDQPSLLPDQPATILFTSGSSGRPKAVMHSVGNHYFNALGANKNIPFGANDRWLLSLSLYHVGGLAILFRALLGGGAIIVPESKDNLLDTALQHGATHMSLVPTQMQRMMKRGREFGVLNEQLKVVLMGGAPIPTALTESAVNLSVPLFTTYGLTEMASQVTTTEAADNPSMLRTAGRPLEGRILKLSDEGEIMVRGKTLFLGYVDGRMLHRYTDPDGWFATGDIGHLDNRGYLTLIGRKDNMFISGGENVHPEEIENALYNVEGVERVVVVAVPDAEFGARPIAFLRWRDGKRAGQTEMISSLKELLPAFKIPDRFIDWPDDLEIDEIKVVRPVLVQRAVALTAEKL